MHNKKSQKKQRRPVCMRSKNYRFFQGSFVTTESSVFRLCQTDLKFKNRGKRSISSQKNQIINGTAW